MECVSTLCDHLAGALHLFISVFVNKEYHYVFFSFQEYSVPGGLRWVDYGCWREEHQGPESSDVAQPISKRQAHGQNPGADLRYISVVLSECIYQHTTVLVSRAASVDRPDCAGVVERVQLPGLQLGPPPPETAAEPALPIPGVLQGDGKRDG
jgi:asparagine N-glycosylation enzyme membrane subunit Stt3